MEQPDNFENDGWNGVSLGEKDDSEEGYGDGEVE